MDSQDYKLIFKQILEDFEMRLRESEAQKIDIKNDLEEIKIDILMILETLRVKIDESSNRTIPREKRYEVLKRQKWSCNECGEKLKYSKNSSWGGEVAHIDHIFPYSKKEEYPKGEIFINDLDNLQALCPKCNKEKYNKTT